ncbi:MAG: acyltransferase [Chromatiales bacterium]|nr:acyltransferase [Chromatiales bacterium]
MISNIQWLRWWAAALVAIYHLRALAPASTAQWLAPLDAIGFGGVDVFFVISGYIMWRTTQDIGAGGAAAWQFVRRRFTRIYSGYWPFAIIALIAVFSLDVPRANDIRIFDSFTLWPHGLHERVIEVSWTLTYELYFYCMFALLLLAGVGLRRRLVIGLIAVLLALNLVGHYAFGLYVGDNLYKLPRLLNMVISPYVLEFLAGCAFAMTRVPARPLIAGGVALALGVAGLVFAGQVNLAAFDGKIAQGFFVVERVAVFGFASLLLLAGGVWLERAGVAPWPRAALLLGGASYALYLAHYVVLQLVVWSAYARWQALVESGVAWFWLLLLAVAAYSVAHYRFVERPLYRAGRRLVGVR